MFDMQVALVLAALAVSVLSKESPVVDSPSGKYRGHILKTRGGRDILSFQGIPYAEPPIGHRRFKDPVKLGRLEGLYDATDGSKECFQPPPIFTQISNISSYVGSEDCLYLNVFTPHVAEGSGPLPVLVWIHGGGFYVGSGSVIWNGPEFLLDQDMILVTMNYRLSIFGFLSTGDSELPGNLGMKDQVMALRWVQENIASFGGDPNQVTLGGVSAGSISASLHMHSPLSQGLFHKVIAQSGTAYSAIMWRPREVVRSYAKEIASNLGCSFDSDQFTKCLQKMPLEELAKAALSVLPGSDKFLTMKLTPVQEEPGPGAFLTKESYVEPSDLPILHGVASQESMWLPIELAQINPRYEEISNLVEDMPEFLPIMGYYEWHPRRDEITKKISQFYFGKDGMAAATFPKIIEFDSDFKFIHGHHLVDKLEKGPKYSYIMSYRGEPVLPVAPVQGLEQGVAHAEECLYLFNIKVLFTRENWTEPDTAVSRQMVQLWYNFIKHGDPTPDTKLWEESEQGTKYLDITNQGLVMKTNMFQDRMEFLDKLNIGRTLNIMHEEL